MVRKIKRKKGNFDVDSFNPYAPNIDDMKKEFREMFFEILEKEAMQEEKRQNFFSSLKPTTFFDLNVVEDVINKAKTLPTGKVKKIKNDATMSRGIYPTLFLMINDMSVYEAEAIKKGELDLNYIDRRDSLQLKEYYKILAKTYLKRYKIGSMTKLRQVMVYMLEQGKRDEYIKYACAESVEDTLHIKERTTSIKARRRKYNFIQKFKNQLDRDVLLLWDMKEILTMAEQGKVAEYADILFNGLYKYTAYSEILKNCKSWKDFAFSCIVGDLLELYQYEGEKEIPTADIYRTYYTALSLLEKNGDWDDYPWIKE